MLLWLLLAGLTGILAALIIHWLTWYIRLNLLSIALVAGATAAAGLTLLFLLYLTSDIANIMMTVLLIFWIAAAVLGYLQARSIPAPWWKGILAVFLEMALAFAAGATVNLSLQSLIPWFNQQFPGIDVYAIIDAFLKALAITLLALAILRPALRLIRRPEQASRLE